MKRPDSQLEEPALFDLPLHAASPAEPRRAVPPRSRSGDVAEPQALSLFPDSQAEDRPVLAPAPVPPAPASEPARPAPLRAGPRPVPPPAAVVDRTGLLPRIASGLADLSVHAAVAVVLVAGSRALGVEGAPPWPPLALCLLLFSFLYFVVPLAFWGKTPGMAWRGLQARARNGQPLSFGQATRRWLGAIATTLLAGLPALGALGGRSFSDLLSGSVVRRDG